LINYLPGKRSGNKSIGVITIGGSSHASWAYTTPGTANPTITAAKTPQKNRTTDFLITYNPFHIFRIHADG